MAKIDSKTDKETPDAGQEPAAVMSEEMLPLVELDFKFIEDVISDLPEGDLVEVSSATPPPVPSSENGFVLYESERKMITRRVNDRRRPGFTVSDDLNIYPRRHLNEHQLSELQQRIIDLISFLEEIPFISVRFDPEWIEKWRYNKPFKLEFVVLRKHPKALEFLSEIVLKVENFKNDGFNSISFQNVTEKKINDLKSSDSLGDHSALVETFQEELQKDQDLEGIDSAIEDLCVLEIDFSKKIKDKPLITRKRTVVYAKLAELLSSLDLLMKGRTSFRDISFDDAK